jgi:nucleotide sugar dehydrogenase
MRIGIIGTGRLGICMALCLDSVGFDVTCYDINQTLMNDIKNKKLETNEPSVADMLKNSNLKVAGKEEDIVIGCDVIFVFIQTPSLQSGGYDHSYIDSFINKCMNINYEKKERTERKIIAISSTVMPEYTDSIMQQLNSVGIDVCYNPTFIAQGCIIANLINPELILIGGYSHSALDTIEAVHKRIIKNNASFHRLTPYEAEITKISINCFITTKIAYANMVGDLLISKNIVPTNVLSAIGSDSRIGNKYLGYGFGFGGPCFPRDNRALQYYANTHGFEFDLCRVTDKLNTDHLLYQYRLIKDSSKEHEFTYITYKDTSDILEESQKLKLAVMLADAGLKVVIKERAHIIEKLKGIYGDSKFVYKCIT